MYRSAIKTMLSFNVRSKGLKLKEKYILEGLLHLNVFTKIFPCGSIKEWCDKLNDGSWSVRFGSLLPFLSCSILD